VKAAWACPSTQVAAESGYFGISATAHGDNRFPTDYSLLNFRAKISQPSKPAAGLFTMAAKVSELFRRKSTRLSYSWVER
jgi:hypothetical protein